MAALIVAGLVLVVMLLSWKLARGVDRVLHKVFGTQPQPRPRRHRPF